jgi:hypothetical protein
MKSELHQKLQDDAKGYLRNKGYWICGLEVPMPQGVCDAWGMKHSSGYAPYNEHGFDAMAIEVKVSRSDFRSRSQKYKEVSGSPLGTFQYVLCPKDMILPHEAHDEWGLLWWSNGRIINKKKAPRLPMTADQKLRVMIHFLHNGVNEKRPMLPSQIPFELPPH